MAASAHPAAAAGDLIEQAMRARVRAGSVALWNSGGAGFVVRTPKTTILIDPFLGEGNSPDWERAVPAPFGAAALRHADAVLMTHEHNDHADPIVLAALAGDPQTRAVAVGPSTATAVAASAGLPEIRRRTLEHDQTMQVGDVRVTAVQLHDPSAKGCNGYVLEAEGVSFLHCGDSLYFPQIGALGDRWRLDALLVSVGLNPPGKVFYMDEADAARAARDTRARTLIPMHFNLWRKVLIDPARVAAVTRWYAPDTKVVPAHYRRRITLSGGAS